MFTLCNPSYTNPALDWYKNGLEAWAQASVNLQAHSREWTDKVAEAARTEIAQTQEEAQRLLNEQNWQALALLWPQACWRLYASQLSATQQVMQQALQSNPDLASGLQQTFAGWQHDVLEAASGSITDMGNVKTLQKSWNAMLQHAQPKAA